jgi:transcriptional regulator with XRE-family HTH domain
MREMIDFNGEKLRILREEKCLTQRELASRAGISQVCLSKMECNHIIPRRAVEVRQQRRRVRREVHESRSVSRR